MTAIEHEGAGSEAWPDAVALPVEIAAAMVAHAQAEYPNEACGIVVGSAPIAEGGRPLRFVACRNAAASPFRYEIDHADLLRVTLETDDRDEAIWAIFHSHTHTPARPSATDVGLAFYPDALYILVSLDSGEADRSTGAPSIRAWRIAGGEATEIAIVTAGSSLAASPQSVEPGKASEGNG